MTATAAQQIQALAEQIKAQNKGRDAEIDRLVGEIVRIASLPPKRTLPIKMVKIVPGGAMG